MLHSGPASLTYWKNSNVPETCIGNSFSYGTVIYTRCYRRSNTKRNSRYNFGRSHFSQRTTTLSINTFDREVTKECPQGSCSGHGIFNTIPYSTLPIRKRLKQSPSSTILYKHWKEELLDNQKTLHIQN